jgi:D-alanyl-D-alanine carboxypeptidase/D-alanyl-D-alanine-endopeptidase (penicillin-binding protein 4)
MWWRAVASVLVGALLGAGFVVDRHAGTPVTVRQYAAPADLADPAAAGLLAPAPDYSALSARLAEVVAAHPVPGAGRVGLAVVDGAGRPVLLDRAGVPLLPASTQKLVTAAAALSALGPDFRYRTVVKATAPIGPDGTLVGDLVLTGSGDPALSTPLFAAKVAGQRPRTPLEALADQVAAAGVRRVTGRVLGDPTALADEPTAPGWLDRYISSLQVGRMSGLMIDAGRQLLPEGETLRARPSLDPAADAAAALTTLLTERGVVVAGSAHSTRRPPPALVQLGAVDSPRLAKLLRYMVQYSDNALAEGVFRTLGRIDGGDGSWAASAKNTVRSLDGLGLDWSGVVIADGSGLSQANRMPAAFLAALDVAMRRSRAQPVWDTLMAVAGETGTLRARLVGTVAEHRLHGKTGTLRRVRCLEGSVAGPRGARIHVAVIGNDLDPAGVRAVRALQDALVTTVVQELDQERSARGEPSH